MKIDRYITSELKKNLIPGRVTVILGARRVGKTTLIHELINENKEKTIFFNCDDPSVREKLSDPSLGDLQRLIGSADLVVFDEAQRIKNIGITLKLITDQLSEKKLLVSGSSSLELANEINEPLTGRKKTYYLYPLSFLELWNSFDQDVFRTKSYLDQWMRYGSYPKLLDFNNDQDKEEYLLELASDYLYKDALEFQEIRNPEQLRKLLIALALQIGQEVSYTELATIVGVDQKTIIKYVDLLEKSFVIFRLPALSRNLRKEISKSRKIYFYDLGIRNALIKNFNTFELRQDKGQVWENVLVIERIKKDTYKRLHKNYYFWRTYDQKEIDLIEEYQGSVLGYEFKWKDTFLKNQPDFLASYAESTVSLVNKDSYLDFVT